MCIRDRHDTIYVVTPEYNANNQLIFRDNTIPAIKGKNVILLLATTTTGLTVRRSLECCLLYTSYDSSGTLLAQIEEGAACDVFFSAAQKQMDTLQNDDQLVVDGTRHNVVNNQVVVITYKGSGTAVTGLENLKDAKSIAMADGSVPVGKYTRQAMVNAGMLDAVDDVSTIPTDVISQALDGVEINECGNVSTVKTQVAEGSNDCLLYTSGMEERKKKVSLSVH